jgi:hypothetical protein
MIVVTQIHGAEQLDGKWEVTVRGVDRHRVDGKNVDTRLDPVTITARDFDAAAERARRKFHREAEHAS